MGKFLEAEKQRQTSFKRSSPYLTDPARDPGIHRGKSRPFCLPRGYAEENLFHAIHQAAMDYFERHEIKWHGGQNGKPSNHLCSSQVCCVNFLFPFTQEPQALVELLRLVFPTIRRVLPMEDNGHFVSFEWIGQHNYLGEKTSRYGKRTRGANFTSADAAVMFDRQDGSRQIALIEWKYTESYSSTSLKISSSGTDRTHIYAPLYARSDCPLNKSLLPDFGDLFYEPFYQLMRQQFLAHEMERAQELGADTVSVLHIVPALNRDFLRITSPGLRPIGETVMEVWKQLVRLPDRFTSVSIEELFGRLPIEELPELKEWWKYLTQRYPWVLNHHNH